LFLNVSWNENFVILCTEEILNFYT